MVKEVDYACAVCFKNFLLVAWYEGISSMEIHHLHFACHGLCLLYIFQGILWSIAIAPFTQNGSGRATTLPRISSCLHFQCHIGYGFYPVVFGVYWLLYGKQAQNVGFDVSVWIYDKRNWSSQLIHVISGIPHYDRVVNNLNDLYIPYGKDMCHQLHEY